MAKRPTSTATEPQRAILSVEQMKRGITRLQKRIDDLEAFDPTSVQKRWSPEVNVLEKAIDETLVAVFGHNTIEYDRYCYVTSLDHGSLFMGQESSPYEVHQYLAEGKKAAILTLQQAIRGLEEEISEQDHIMPPINSPVVSPTLARKVFIVHGHDEASRVTLRIRAKCDVKSYK